MNPSLIQIITLKVWQTHSNYQYTLLLLLCSLRGLEQGYMLKNLILEASWLALPLFISCKYGKIWGCIQTKQNKKKKQFIMQNFYPYLLFLHKPQLKQNITAMWKFCQFVSAAQDICVKEKHFSTVKSITMAYIKT